MPLFRDFFKLQIAGMALCTASYDIYCVFLVVRPYLNVAMRDTV